MAAVTLKDAPADHVITTYAALLKRQGKVRLLHTELRRKTVKKDSQRVCLDSSLISFSLFLSLSLSLPPFVCGCTDPGARMGGPRQDGQLQGACAVQRRLVLRPLR